MTGLNLDTFLRLVRADWGIWLSLGAIVVLLALITWTTWGSRRALRKCLVLSVVLHFVLVLFGSGVPMARRALWPGESKVVGERIRQIKLESWNASAKKSADGRPTRRRLLAEWDRPNERLALVDAPLKTSRPANSPEANAPERATPAPTALPEVDPKRLEINPPAPAGPENRPTRAPSPDQAIAETAVAGTAQGAPDEVADPVIARARGADSPSPIPGDRRPRVRPQLNQGPTLDRPELTRADQGPVALPEPKLPNPTGDLTARTLEPRPRLTESPGVGTQSGTSEGNAAVAAAAGDPNEVAGPTPRTRRDANPAGTGLAMPDPDRLRRSPGASTAKAAPPRAIDRPPLDFGPPAQPRDPNSGAVALTSPEPRDVIGNRSLDQVPEVYRSRLDPDRSARAQRAGASAASEQAVERALDWLSKHQDADGRWDAGTYRAADGTLPPGQDDHTVHCPPGDICFGPCAYWEADTALTGLALLAYLGAGHTQAEGRYAQTVEKGIDYLLSVQKPDGDLRGSSRAVGMYCHTMAALALCEAYALTGDSRLRRPVELAVDFVVKAQTPGGLGWRYSPREPLGDTSVLGWAVLVLKSAKEIGLPIPLESRAGALAWLERVRGGGVGGLASYQPGKPPSPTMTAEAWVCRQFLGVGGPGPASDEAASELLRNGPQREFNLYYWYYGTLAMYQRGGPDWTRWNGQVRNQLVSRQKTSGHAVGSWDPNEAGPYDRFGGRIYATAMATLTLEVYYRYLRLYEPLDSSEAGPGVELARPVPPVVRSN